MNRGFKIEYPYTQKTNIEYNLLFPNKSNIVKIPKKGLYNVRKKTMGDLYIIFNITNEETYLNESEIQEGIETYENMDLLSLI